jgi:hypothetical protein
MTSRSLVLLLFQAQGPDNLPAGATKPWRSASPTGRWHYLASGAPRPGAFARVGLGVDHAR